MCTKPRRHVGHSWVPHAASRFTLFTRKSKPIGMEGMAPQVSRPVRLFADRGRKYTADGYLLFTVARAIRKHLEPSFVTGGRHKARSDVLEEDGQLLLLVWMKIRLKKETTKKKMKERKKREQTGWGGEEGFGEEEGGGGAKEKTFLHLSMSTPLYTYLV